MNPARLAGAFSFEPNFPLADDLDPGDLVQIKRMHVFLQVVDIVRTREACWTPLAVEYLGLETTALDLAEGRTRFK